MGRDGELKSFGHAPIRLRGVIRRRDLSLLKIQFFRTTEDDFIARAAKTQWKEGSERVWNKVPITKVLKNGEEAFDLEY